jgi:DivIVA domain-containing protein
MIVPVRPVLDAVRRRFRRRLRASGFARSLRGYHRHQVDAFIDRLEGTLGRAPLYAAPVSVVEVGDVNFNTAFGGYRMRPVDDAIEQYTRELEGRGGRRHRMAASDVDRLIGLVRNVRFAGTRRDGYHEGQVDEFLNKMIVALREYHALASDVRAARFSVTRVRRGYRQAEVDAFLDHLAAEIERAGRNRNRG